MVNRDLQQANLIQGAHRVVLRAHSRQHASTLFNRALKMLLLSLSDTTSLNSAAASFRGHFWRLSTSQHHSEANCGRQILPSLACSRRTHNISINSCEVKRYQVSVSERTLMLHASARVYRCSLWEGLPDANICRPKILWSTISRHLGHWLTEKVAFDKESQQI